MTIHTETDPEFIRPDEIPSGDPWTEPDPAEEKAFMSRASLVWRALRERADCKRSGG